MDKTDLIVAVGYLDIPSARKREVVAFAEVYADSRVREVLDRIENVNEEAQHSYDFSLSVDEKIKEIRAELDARKGNND